MATPRSFAVPVDLEQNEILNPVAHLVNGLSQIASPTEGQFAYDLATHELYVWDGVDWQPAGDETLYWMDS